MKSNLIQVGDQRLSFIDTGAGDETLFFVHGNSGSKDIWSHVLVGDLAKKCRLIAVDLPGHGQSPAPENRDKAYTLQAIASTCADLLRKLKVARPVLVGNSLGGHIAISMIDQMEATKGLMIFGTPPLGLPPAFDKAFVPNPNVAVMFAANVPADAARAAMSAMVVDKTHVKRLVDVFQSTDPSFREKILASIAGGVGIIDEISAVRKAVCPVAIVHGEADGLVNLNYIRELELSKLWHGKVEVIKGGHLLSVDNPVGLSSLLVDFLADIK